MTTTTVSVLRANLDRATELRRELRQIDEAATAAARDYTAAERSTIDASRAELEQIEARVAVHLDYAERGAAIDAGMDTLPAAVTNYGTTIRSTRGIGNLSPVSFDVRTLFDQYHERGGTSIEARAVTAVPMAQVSGQRLNPVTFRREPTRIAARIPTELVETGSVRFYRGSTAASAADSVAEGDTKPESTPGWTGVDVPICKIAHWTAVSKEALDDFANFEQVVTEELVAGLIHAENGQVLAGDGTAPNISGLLDAAVQTYAPAGAEARYLSILHAATLLRTGTSYVEPDTVLLHPNDWEVVVKTASTATGELLIAGGSVTAGVAPELWGTPVVLTTAVTAGTAVVANLAEAAVVFQREAPTIFVDPYGQAEKNMVRFVCEERLALGVVRPTAVVSVTFNGTT